MKLQTLFTKLNVRTISAAICVSLVSSCAYDTYPVSSNYGSSPYDSPYGTPYGSPYGNTQTVSDPTIPLILGASAIGALAYYGKKKHDDHHDYNHYNHRNYNNHNNHYSHRSHTHYSNNQRNHYVTQPSCRNNHTSSYKRSNNYASSNHTNSYNHSNQYNSTNHSNYNRSSVRDSAREALERRRETPRHENRTQPQTRPQVSQPDRSRVVSHYSKPRELAPRELAPKIQAPREQAPRVNIQTRIKQAEEGARNISANGNTNMRSRSKN